MKHSYKTCLYLYVLPRHTYWAFGKPHAQDDYNPLELLYVFI
ncbi:hypothetical protein HMPREF3232_00371 [Fannyhessea vaginae]|nr:hypothetical protein HMPREF3232_00371 [Fannyhessea vaginae]